MKRKMMFAASALVLLAGCSNDDTKVVSSKLPNELGVSINVNASTRAASGEVTEFKDNSQVGILIAGLDASKYTSKTATYTFDATNWNGPALEENKLFLNPSDANVYGYFPAGSPVDADTKIMTCDNIPVTQSFTATEADDYMYSTGAATDVLPTVTPSIVSSTSATTTKANLYFHHALAKVSFVVNMSKTYSSVTTPGALSKIEFNATNKFATSGKLNLATGVFTSDAASADKVTLEGTATANAYNDVASKVINAYGFFAPRASLSDITLVFTIDGVTMSKALSTNVVAEWESGYQYIYTVTVQPKAVELTCQIVPWVSKKADLGTIQ